MTSLTSPLLLFVISSYPPLLHLHSFPTRRSSDLALLRRAEREGAGVQMDNAGGRAGGRDMGHRLDRLRALHEADRKSTRLNSSHVSISYAVFCLKKKKHNIENEDTRTSIGTTLLD